MNHLSKLQSEAVLKFRKEFLMPITSVMSNGQFLEKVRGKLPDLFEKLLSDQIQKAVEGTLDLIAEDQGWEESRDIYADALELPLKYPKLMEAYKKRNHIKGKIILDSQLSKEKQNDR